MHANSTVAVQRRHLNAGHFATQECCNITSVTLEKQTMIIMCHGIQGDCFLTPLSTSCGLDGHRMAMLTEEVLWARYKIIDVYM